MQDNFEKQLWKVACRLWGHISASEYRKVIVGLLFLRKALTEETNVKVPDGLSWEQVAESKELGLELDNTMIELERSNPALVGVLPKVYSDLDNDILRDIVKVFRKMDLENNAELSSDTFGRVYEYCLEQFAKKEGVRGGEYYTPPCVVRLLTKILEPKKGDVVYDPCCGTGGMFIGSGRKDLFFCGQEANTDTWKMAKMNALLHGVSMDVKKEDTFTNDLFPDLKADIILANPPFNYHPWGAEKLKDDPRWELGLPPENNANFAWIEHMLYHLKDDGKIGLVLSNNALSTQNKAEKEIRKRLIEDGYVDGIIALPNKLFYSVTLPVSIWILSKQKVESVAFFDARQMGTMTDRKHRELTNNDIKKIADAFHAHQRGERIDEVDFCKVASLEEVREQKYILTPGRYVESESKEEPTENMEDLAEELDKLFKESRKLERTILKNLKELGYGN